MILNNMVQQIAMQTFRVQTPRDTGHLAEDAVKLIPVISYDKFSIYVDAKVAHYGHILEVAESIKYYTGPRAVPKEERPFIVRPNKHYGWITKKAIPAVVQKIAKTIGGKVIY